MQEKVKLISSISNLIKYRTRLIDSHVSMSRQNQEQIFDTLSEHDFRKILTNLQDVNEKLRKVTLVLLARLLYDNLELKKKFCGMMNVYPGAGKIMFSAKLPKILLNDPVGLCQFFSLLKQSVTTQQTESYFWIVDPYQKPLAVHFVQSLKAEIDPINLIIGFVMPFASKESEKIPNGFCQLKAVQPEMKLSKEYRQNHSFQEQPSNKEKWMSKQDSINSKNSSTRMSLEEELASKHKYYIQSQTKPRDNIKFNSFTEKKAPPPIEVQLKNSYKDFDRSVKYIKPSCITTTNQTIPHPQRTPNIPTTQTSSLRGNETTRQRLKNIQPFIKVSEISSQNIFKYQPMHQKNTQY